MARYRLYLMDPDGHIVRAEDMDAGTDAEAVKAARQLHAIEALELWCNSRKVMRLESAASDFTERCRHHREGKDARGRAGA